MVNRIDDTNCQDQELYLHTVDKQLELLINQQKDKYLNSNNEEIEMLTEDSNNKSIVKEKLI